MPSLLDHDDLIVAVSQRNGVKPELVRALMELEARFPNLHGYGARPALRREMMKIIEESFGTDMTGNGGSEGGLPDE